MLLGQRCCWVLLAVLGKDSFKQTQALSLLVVNELLHHAFLCRFYFLGFTPVHFE